MTIQEYIKNINDRYKLGNATEHTFRGDLQQLIESLCPAIRATNEPKRQYCGAPDYILTKKDIPVGYIEAKDIGDKDLDGEKKTGNKEQFDRYKASLNNLFFTDYIDFHLYRNGQFVTKIAIAELTNKGLQPLVENFGSFENLIKTFCTHIGQTIKSSKKLAEMMADKARLLAEVIEKALTSDETHNEDSTLKDQMNAFKLILIHNITPKGFADVYAQTITYGMFAARLHDPTLENFSRQEAAELIPKSNPFLRKLFGYIAGPDLDDRIKWIVDDLINIFLACNVAEILNNYGSSTKMEDPIIHFYEDFLSQYDPKLRKARGVWYTPAPVVNFIVRAVDDILKTEFDLPQGLADSSKIEVETGHGLSVRKSVHKVQILDPATGTGTFLTEVIKHIYNKGYKTTQGLWSNYVENHLLPRLNGFELLMASYAMAHLKLDLLLTETGYKPTSNQRLRVYLTNSLEEHHPDTGTLFANWLSAEANEANHIKHDVPVMCIIGNPPYSGTSANMTDWIMDLIEDYKDKNEKMRRGRRWIQDDYVKFIRLGHHLIEKNEEGILAFINPHGFLDNPTFSGMRLRLLQTFNKIFTIDLHGNAKKKEVRTDGATDQNVFDIMQGVSINIFVKTKKQTKLSKVFHYELFGKREEKYNFLIENTINSIRWNELYYSEPNYFFVPKNDGGKIEYLKGFKIDELFTLNTTGIVTAIDRLSIFQSIEELQQTTKKILNATNPYIEFCISDALQTTKEQRLEELKIASRKNPTSIYYRPFDIRYMFYTRRTHGWINSPRFNVMQHFIKGENIGFASTKRIEGVRDFADIFVFNKIIQHHSLSIKEVNNIFPLYLYKEHNDPKNLFAGKESDRLKLQAQLELAKANFKQVSEFFHSIVKPYFDKIEKPNESAINLFEEHKSLYEEAQVTLESLKTNIKKYDKSENFFIVEQEKELGRVPNLNTEIVKQIAECLGLEFVAEKNLSDFKNPADLRKTFAPIDILDYIYAVLHSPTYREKYKEFLKIDFPRVPYPKEKETFWQLVKLGGELRQIHLLEHPVVENYITQYPIDGNHTVTKPRFERINPQGFENLVGLGRVYINDTQYFDNVPEVAWNFYIGGYQPTQKWLKDRKDQKLEFDDLLHYQKIIVALTQTDRIMKEIDLITIE